MSTLFERLQHTFEEAIPAYQALIREVQSAQPQLRDFELARSYALLRLGMALQHWQESGEGASDVLVLLRQVLRSYRQRLILPESLWQQLNRNEVFWSLRALDTDKAGQVELVADNWRTNWLEGTEELDRLHKRRNDEPAIGDGLLYAMSGGAFWRYQSKAQQIATHAHLFAEPGSTLLVMLPTGSGKSVVAQLPTWLNAQTNAGTTIVVVPTVALALDQEIKVLQYFGGSEATAYIPRSWTAQTSPEMRQQIIQEIKSGDLPLLYVSPEALMQSSLYHTCLQAAEEGKLQRLVIDEAHIIESWGAGFRTDFQFLATYRAQLLARSQGKLQTLLLSATVSASCTHLLKQLFGEPGPFYQISANRLRPEPSYWFSSAQWPSIRDRRILEALWYLPRPLILYVSTLKDAAHWQCLLREKGFRRLASFTGETPGEERLHLITSWNKSEIDLMVATSAFGMGVDKGDVRSIIHACLPESLERFYQEVGRAGRDGYSSVSLMCTTIDDFEIAKTMLRGARITTEKAIARWEGMRQLQPIRNQEHANMALVDLNAPPAGSPDMRPGKANLGWNEHTLLLMQRAGLIQITSTNEKIAQTVEEDSESNLAVQPRYLKLQLLRPELTAYPDNERFKELLEAVRNQERQEIEANLQYMKQVAAEYSNKQAQVCLAQKLAELYPSCALACGGCPVCRAEGSTPYEQSLPVEIEPELEVTPVSALREELRQLLGAKAVMNVTWENTENVSAVQTQLASLLADLVGAGMQQLLLPAELLADQQWTHELMRLLARHLVPHQLITYKDLDQETPLYALPTVVVYPRHNHEADNIHRQLRSTVRLWKKQSVPLIHVVPRLLFLESEAGYFMDRIDGTSKTIRNLQSLLTQWQEPALF
ncbi:MAG: protein DpdF [Ktedonobacteraceae bacterium]